MLQHFLSLFIGTLAAVLLLSLHGLPWFGIHGDIEEARRSQHAHLNVVVDAKKRQFETWLAERVADSTAFDESRAILDFLDHPSMRNGA